MNKFIKTYLSLLSITTVVLILDQASKYLVRTRLFPGQIYKLDFGPFSFIELVHLQNFGALMSIFKGMNLLFICLAIAISAVIIFAASHAAGNNNAMRLALGLLLGGVASNLIDRLAFGAVTDFIVFWNTAVVNIADLSIFLGVLVMAYAIWAQERKPAPRSEENTPADDSLLDDEDEMSASEAHQESEGSLPPEV